MSKTILITGGSTGIGAAITTLMAAGNKIFLHYNSSVDAAKETARRVESNGGEAFLIWADLSSEAGCETLIKETSAHTEHLDVLINNAGGLVERQYCRELQWELLERVFALNTFSAMKVTSLAIPLLENWRQGTPLQKNGQAGDMAHAVKFLIENQFTTGETVDVNGGTQMR